MMHQVSHPSQASLAKTALEEGKTSDILMVQTLGGSNQVLPRPGMPSLHKRWLSGDQMLPSQIETERVGLDDSCSMVQGYMFHCCSCTTGRIMR